ncbi:MAG: hypothetical protein AAGA75_04720 [Cyanobacteria bacterium P01_E01_bin.6]
MNPNHQGHRHWIYLVTAGLLGLASPANGQEALTEADTSSKMTNGGDGISFDLPDAWENKLGSTAVTEAAAQPIDTPISASPRVEAIAPTPPSVQTNGSLDSPANQEQQPIETAAEPSQRPERLLIPSTGFSPPSSFSKNASVLQELPPPPPRPATEIALDALFHGGSDSLVAIAIGRAEGTRLPDGRKTFAYYGRTNTSTQAWRIGTFSSPEEATSPEEADQQYLNQLYQQATTLQQQAIEQDLQWNDETQLNAIDVAHQSTDAALGNGGFVRRLQQAHTMGMSDSEAILWARTRSFLDPDTEEWNSPRRPSSVQEITDDQARRQEAIAQVLAHRQEQPPQPVSGKVAVNPLTLIEQHEDEQIGALLSLDLSAI